MVIDFYIKSFILLVFLAHSQALAYESLFDAKNNFLLKTNIWYTNSHIHIILVQ